MDINYNSGDIESAISKITTCLETLTKAQQNAKNAADTVLSNVGGELNSKLSLLFTDNTTVLNNATSVINSFIAALTTVKTEYQAIEDDIMAKIDAVLNGGGAAPAAQPTQQAAQFSTTTM